MIIMRTRLHVSALPSAFVLLSLMLILSGCSLFSSAKPTATATPTPTSTEDVSTSQPVKLPTVSCDQAVQMIEQKQVSIVKVWYAKDGTFAFIISIIMPQATPVPGSLAGDIDVYSGFHNQPTVQCLAQVQAAIKQVNGTLPASQQVKVEHETVYGG